MSPMNTVDAELLAAVRGCYGAVRMRDLEPTRTQRRHIASLVRAGELIAHEHGVVGIPGVPSAPLFWHAFMEGSSPARQPCATTGYPWLKGPSRFILWLRQGDNSQLLDARSSTETVVGLGYRRPLTRFSRSLRRWLVSCAATSRTTLRSSLLTQHFTMSGSLLSRFAACCAAPARLGRSHDSIAPVTGPVPRWRRWREWILRLPA